MRSLRPILSAAALLFVLQTGSAQSPWAEGPEKIALATGLPCIYQHDVASATTVVQIFLPGGRGAVPAGSDGLAYLATSLCLEIPDEVKARSLMAQATRLSLSVWEDCSIIHIECLSENLEAAMHVASDIIQDPLLTGIRIDRTTKTMVLRGRAAQDDSEAGARDAVLRALYGGSGYGTTAFGTEDTLKSLSKKDVTEFRRHFRTRAGLFFSVGSDLDRGAIQASLEKHFTKFPPGEASDLQAQLPSLPQDREIVIIKDAQQAFLGRAFILPAPGPSVYAKALLLEAALGRGPGSRLWTLRSSGRLAYNVNARTVWTRHAGVLEAYLETEATKAERASSALEDILRTLHEEGLSEREFRAAQATASTHFLRSAETKPMRTRIAGMFEVLGLGCGYLSGVSAAIDAVTLPELNAFLRDVLGSDRALRVTIGPAGPRSEY